MFLRFRFVRRNILAVASCLRTLSVISLRSSGLVYLKGRVGRSRRQRSRSIRMGRCIRTEGRETDRVLETAAVSERVTGSVGDVIRGRSVSSRASLVGSQPVDRMGGGTVDAWTIGEGLLADSRVTIRNRDPANAMLIGIGTGGEGLGMLSRKLALAVQLWKVMRCH